MTPYSPYVIRDCADWPECTEKQFFAVIGPLNVEIELISPFPYKRVFRTKHDRTVRGVVIDCLVDPVTIRRQFKLPPVLAAPIDGITECDEIAANIAKHAAIPPTLDACTALVQSKMPGQSHQTIDNVAWSLWRSGRRQASAAALS